MSLTVGLGIMIGKITIRGINFGISGALFVGLFIGAFGYKVPNDYFTWNLMFFVVAVGLLAAEDTAVALGMPVRMRLVSYAFVGVEPEVMGIGPIPAAEKALRQAGLTIEDIGLFELNEAFAVQVLAFLDHYGIADDDERVNPWGGAIAIGHPLASSGVRLMTQLAHHFEENPQVRYGLVAMCIGIGMGGCVIWENPHHADYGKEN
mgnify:CR=1 FL=1